MNKGMQLLFFLVLSSLSVGCGGGLRLQESEISREGSYHKLVAVTLKNTGEDFRAANIRIKVHDEALAQTQENVSKDGKSRTRVTIQAAPVLVLPLPGVVIMPGEEKRCSLPEGGRRFKAEKPLVKVAGYDKVR